MILKICETIVAITMTFALALMFWVAFFFDNLDGLIK